MKLNVENIDYFLFMRQECLLSTQECLLLEEYIKANPELKKDSLLWEETNFKITSLEVYPKKINLNEHYETEEKVRYGMLGGEVLLALIFWIMMYPLIIQGISFVKDLPTVKYDSRHQSIVKETPLDIEKTAPNSYSKSAINTTDSLTSNLMAQLDSINNIDSNTITAASNQPLKSFIKQQKSKAIPSSTSESELEELSPQKERIELSVHTDSIKVPQESFINESIDTSEKPATKGLKSLFKRKNKKSQEVVIQMDDVE